MNCPKCGCSMEGASKEPSLESPVEAGKPDRMDALLEELMSAMEAHGVGKKLSAEPNMMSIEMLAAKPKKKPEDEEEEEPFY